MADLQRVSAGIFEKLRVVSRTFVIAGTFNAARASPARNRCQPVDLCRAFGPKGNPAGVGPELAAAAWALRDSEGLPPFFVVGSARVVEEAARRRGISVPVYTVIVRKCFGVAGGSVMDRAGLNFKIAWPSASWGSLPIEGGVKAAYRKEIEEAPDPKAREAEIEAELRALSSPFRTAEAFAVEDLIDPRETRPYLCQFIDAAQNRLRTQLGPKARTGVRP